MTQYPLFRVEARQFIRRMRGGAQANLIECSDGHSYIVKFRNNPQHGRVLINEYLAARLMEHLGIEIPPCELIYVTREFIKDNPEAGVQLGHRHVAPAVGLAFGSRLLPAPHYDYLPDSLLSRISNPEQFLGALAFDKWTSNADARQAVFTHVAGTWKAVMIDNGYCWNGPQWAIHVDALSGTYHRPLVYEQVTGLNAFEPWLDRIRNIPPQFIRKAIATVPCDWLESGEGDLLKALGERLIAARRTVHRLIEVMGSAPRRFFQNWRQPAAAVAA